MGSEMGRHPLYEVTADIGSMRVPGAEASSQARVVLPVPRPDTHRLSWYNKTGP